MKLVQPAAYEGHGKEKWIKLQDLLAIAKREFGIGPSEVWSDLREWQKPHGGLVWTIDGVTTMNSESDAGPDGFDTVYILEGNARYFYNQASNGAREVRFVPEEGGWQCQWARP